jgi:hypothetical protein
LGAELGKLRFAFREPRANGGKLLALVEEVEIVRGLLEEISAGMRLRVRELPV